MPQDRYGLALSTASPDAADAYVAGVDATLSANVGAEEAFRRAIAIDEGFALAHAALARTLQVLARPAEAKAAVARARAASQGLPQRERSHVEAIATMIEAGGAAGLAAARAHLADHPRDAMVLAPCTGVFGLIGFSGLAGREAELLALLDRLAPAYGDDWWFTSAHAFAQVEAGEVDRAYATIERSLAANPRNANGAHIRSHVYYEGGEREAGLAYLRDWWRDYPKAAQLHCHLSWHIALWEMALGRPQNAWQIYDEHLRPGGSWGPPINTLSDSASFLLRAEMGGEPRRPELWREVSRYAAESYPATGIAFVDVHAALAHAFAGDSEALARIIANAKGKAADVVAPLGRAFGALAREDWPAVIDTLRPVMAAHERIGGSRAQRDLIEYTLLMALLRAGRTEEARTILQRRARSLAGIEPVRAA